MDAEILHLCALVRGEGLHKFEFLYANIENTETLNVDYYIKGLVLYFPCELYFKTNSHDAPQNEKRAD